MHLKFLKPSRLDQKLPLSPHPPKADTSSKGGHVLQRRTLPRPLHYAFGLAGRKWRPDYQYFTIFGLLAYFSAGPIIWRQFAWLSSQKHAGKQDVEN